MKLYSQVLFKQLKFKKTFTDTAKPTKSVFSIKDNKNVLASDAEIAKDKANYLHH